MGGQVCRQICQRVSDSGDALDTASRGQWQFQKSVPGYDPLELKSRVAATDIAESAAVALVEKEHVEVGLTDAGPAAPTPMEEALTASVSERALLPNPYVQVQLDESKSKQVVPKPNDASEHMVGQDDAGRLKPTLEVALAVSVENAAEPLEAKDDQMAEPIQDQRPIVEEYQAARLAILAVEAAPPAGKSAAWIRCEEAWAKALAVKPDVGAPFAAAPLEAETKQESGPIKE